MSRRDPPGARFCPSCGHATTSPDDERRVVTVLFADIVGFTTLSETLDPERVKRLVDSWFERLVADITDFGGRVDKIVGDGILALFGAPIAHEDDAERAVRAALRMQETLADMAERAAGGPGPKVQMRIGVNTGEVLVGAMRADGAITAMGDVVNTASRLQTAARPGEVLVGPSTHALTVHAIAAERRGLLTARGRDAPVEAWSAVRALLPPGQRPDRDQVPLVGRNRELGLLDAAVATALGHQRAFLGVIVGDTGRGQEPPGPGGGRAPGRRAATSSCWRAGASPTARPTCGGPWPRPSSPSARSRPTTTWPGCATRCGPGSPPRSATRPRTATSTG